MKRGQVNAKLAALLVGGIAATVGGIAVVLWTPDPTAGRADLLDAGITQDFTPRRLSCGVYFDGGYAQRTFIVAAAKTLRPDGLRDTIWPRSAIPFRRAIVGGDATCRVTGSPTWAQAANFDDDPTDEPFSCACAPADGGCLLADAGLSGKRAYLAAGEFGVGCVPRPCNEWAGVDGTPEACR